MTQHQFWATQKSVSWISKLFDQLPCHMKAQMVY